SLIGRNDGGEQGHVRAADRCGGHGVCGVDDGGVLGVAGASGGVQRCGCGQGGGVVAGSGAVGRAGVGGVGGRGVGGGAVVVRGGFGCGGGRCGGGVRVRAHADGGGWAG